LFPVWHRIGTEVESTTLGRHFVLLVFAATPLWFYWLFLRKDMAITLLQSLFLLSVVLVTRRGWSFGNVALALFSTVAVIPFRVQLALVNVGLLLSTVALTTVRKGTALSRFLRLGGALGVAAVALALASNASWLESFGVVRESRVLGESEYAETMFASHDNSAMRRTLFPLLYIVSETEGFSPLAWEDFGPNTIRGLMAVPWILLGVPFLFLGLRWLFSYGDDVGAARRREFLSINLADRVLFRTPWSALLMLFLAYAAVSWVGGDTTRWRIPGVPAMYALAWLGWCRTTPSSRTQILVWWVLVLGMMLSLFHLIKSSI
jgi:hypothetical protein